MVATGCASSESEQYKQALADVQDYLAETVTEPTSNSVGGEWALIALTQGGYDVSDEFLQKYKKNTEDLVKNADGVLNTPTGYKYTEYSRVILGWTAAGGDARNVAGYDFLEKLACMDDVCRQGINGPIWALIAYDCGGYEVPKIANNSKGNNTTREELLKYLVQNQMPDGGWTLSGDTSDVDLTAMALTAMAPYISGNEKLCEEVSAETLSEVKTASEKAISCLADKKMDDGGFESWGAENAESCAQVITALASLGIDVQEDERFAEILEALLGYQQEDGGFAHTMDTGTNIMATEQAAYALAAYDRVKSGEPRLFDMR